MRKDFCFIAFLSLFLFLSDTITRGQTVSVSGVVYQNNMAKIPFSAPEGKITVYLPDDMAAGDHITGTVVMEASGKNEKEKQKNLNLLKQYGVKIADFAIDVRNLSLQSSNTPGVVASNFNLPDKWWGIAHNVAPVSLTKMKEPMAKVEIPLIQFSNSYDFDSAQFIDFATLKIDYKVQKNVITSGENIVLLHSSVTVPDDGKPVVVFSLNQQDIKPLCISPRQTIFSAAAAITGKNQINAKMQDGKTVYSDEFYKVDIEATIDKQNLKTNERTNMNVGVQGLKECPYPVWVTIVNNSTQTVLLDKGTHQTYSYRPFNDQFGDGDQDGMNTLGSMSISQGVTGVTPGAYDITANLILPTMAFGDVFHQQKSALKTPEDYNAWVDALKKDLKAYADKQGNDEVGKAAKVNAERAIDNIPKCNDKNKLDECKAFADAYLRPVNIPKGAAIMWVCGFEAYKAAIKAITGTLGGKAELIDWEVIKNGLEFIRNMGEQLKDEGLQNGAKDAKKLVETIQKAGETKEKLQELKDKLDELNEGMEGKTSLNPSLLHAYTTEDLLVSSFISNIPAYRTMTGTDAGLNINGQPSSGILSVNKSGNGTYQMQIAPGQSTELTNWINSFMNNNPAPVKLDIIVPPKPGTSPGGLDFKNALIQEIEFPKMDASGKDMMKLNVTIKPEEIKYTGKVEKIKTPDTKEGKQWMPSNFKIELGDLPCKHINKLDIPKITQKIADYKTGEPRKPEIIPGKIEWPNITFSVPEADIQPWKNWFDEYVKTDKTLDGNIFITDATGQPIFILPLNNVKPGGVIYANPAGDKTYNVIIKPGESGKAVAETPQGQPSKGPDRVNDLIGVFNPFTKILFYNPQYQQQIFSKMQPHIKPDGKYDVNVLTANRKPVRTSISMIPASPAALFDQSVQLEEKMNEVLCDQQDTKPQDKPDRTPAERITETWDSTGTGYRVYKNARCERFKEGGEVPCFAEEVTYPDNISGTEKRKKTGKYHKMVYSPLSHCFKGTEFCTEMYFLDLLIYVYDDANCKRLIDVKKYYAWSCE
ncbi:MAG: hypothetical protein ACT4OJ_13795 [Bacteroidota bacterium]